MYVYVRMYTHTMHMKTSHMLSHNPQAQTNVHAFTHANTCAHMYEF